MGLAVKFAVLHELSMNFQVMGIANHGAAFPLDHQNGSNTLYSSCLTGDFVTQSASSHFTKTSILTNKCNEHTCLTLK